MEVWLCQLSGDGRPTCPDNEEITLKVDIMPCLYATYPDESNDPVLCKPTRNDDGYCVDGVQLNWLHFVTIGISCLLVIWTMFRLCTLANKAEKEIGHTLDLFPCPGQGMILTIAINLGFIVGAAVLYSMEQDVSDVFCRGQPHNWALPPYDVCGYFYECNGPELSRNNSWKSAYALALLASDLLINLLIVSAVNVALLEVARIEYLSVIMAITAQASVTRATGQN